MIKCVIGQSFRVKYDGVFEISPQINYLAAYKHDLVKMIRSETSGDFRKLMETLAQVIYLVPLLLNPVFFLPLYMCQAVTHV